MLLGKKRKSESLSWVTRGDLSIYDEKKKCHTFRPPSILYIILYDTIYIYVCERNYIVRDDERASHALKDKRTLQFRWQSCSFCYLCLCLAVHRVGYISTLCRCGCRAMTYFMTSLAFTPFANCDMYSREMRHQRRCINSGATGKSVSCSRLNESLTVSRRPASVYLQWRRV